MRTARRVLTTAASLTVLAAAAPAVAQTAPQNQPTEVEEVIVTAAPYGIAEDASIANLDVIRQEEIDVARAGGLGELLSDLPGVRSTAFGAGASRPVIRGLQGPRVQVLNNGVGTIDASALSPDHAVATDPLEAKRIEVLRGPAALAYGGNAIGGVVNVIDERVPTVPARRGLEGRVTLQGSTVDDGGQIGAEIKAGEGPWVFSADAIRRETQDYDIPGPAESAAYAALEGEEPEDEGYVENSASELTQYGAGLSYVTGLGYLGFSAKRTETNYGVPGHAHHHEDPLDPMAEEEEEAVTIDLEQTRYDVRGELNVGFGPFDRAKLSLGWAEYEHTEFEGSEVGTRFLSEGFEGRLELVQAERDGWNGAVGLQVLSRDLDAIGDEAYVPRSEIREVGAFVLQRLDRGPWGVEGGLRLDNREIESAVGSRDFDNISASINLFARPSEGVFLGVSFSRNARAPSEAELFAEGPHVATRAYEIGDDDLDSEVAYTLEATAHFETGPVSIDAHVYASKFDGFIDLIPTGDEEDDLPVFQYVQTDAEFVGFELEGDWRVWSNGVSTLTLEGEADYVRGDTDLGAPARIPPWSLTGRAVYEIGRWDARLEVRHVGEQDRVAEFELPTESYTLVNLYGAYKPFADRELTLFAEARNLTDEEAREHVSFLKDLTPLPGRNFRAGLAWRF